MTNSNQLNIIFASWGNDSLALVQWAIQHKLDNVIVAYSDTQWASKEWPGIVNKREEFARLAGFKTVRIPSEGMANLVRRKKGWPGCRKFQFCTTELKILPAQQWLATIDPDKEAMCLTGVRRCESKERADWPEYLMESEKHEGRELWSPLVDFSDAQRDALIANAGFSPLPHRSMECFPCVCSNRTDLRMLTADRITEIEIMELQMGTTSKDNLRTMFRPYRHMGAIGIREVHKWAMSDHGKYQPAGQVCDSGFCGG